MDHAKPESSGARRESEAVVNARSRLALVAETQGRSHPEYATALNQLALLRIMQGESDSAELLLREALEVRLAALGRNHPDYATNLSSLGGLLWARGALDEAEPLFRQAAEIRCATLGQAHPKSVVSLNSLEQLLRAKQNATPAEPAVGLPSVSEPTPRATSPGPIVAIPGVSPSSPAPRVRAPVRIGPVEIPEDIIPEAAPAPSPVLPVPAAPAPSLVPPPPVVPVLAPGAFEGPEFRPSFAGELGELTGVFEELSHGLTRAARDASTVGALPSEALMERCAAARRRFESLGASVRASARELGVPLDAGAPASLEAIHTLIPRLRAADEQNRARLRFRAGAIAVLERVERLDHPADRAFAPLLTCRNTARTLREAVDSAASEPPEAAVIELAEGRHPFHSLLRLVAADDSLDDNAWAELFEAVASSLGVPLATAAARRRIVARND